METETIFSATDISVLVAKSTFVVADIIFKEAVINSSLAMITFA